MGGGPPFVSVLIPAYRALHLGEALASACAQRYARMEIVVCDDSGGGEIRAAMRGFGDPRIRYLRNPRTLGLSGNFTRCFESARGAFIKFLNDDDRLLPDCVETLASMLQNPSVRLATSRRRVIDARGLAQPDVAATTPVSHVSALVRGRELGDLALLNGLNLVGEPTTAMFRRADLEVEGGDVFQWGGRRYQCLADLGLWLRLLARGHAYYHAAPLSEFRLHGLQEQRHLALDCIIERLWIARQARREGFLASTHEWRIALQQVQARAGACPRERLDTAGRARLAQFDFELDVELAAMEGRPTPG